LSLQHQRLPEAMYSALSSVIGGGLDEPGRPQQFATNQQVPRRGRSRPQADLQGLCDIITERLKRLYVIDADT
jgi:hypothetical protein